MIRIYLHDVPVLFIGPWNHQLSSSIYCQTTQKVNWNWGYQNWWRKTQADEAYALNSYARKVAESNLSILELAEFLSQ